VSKPLALALAALLMAGCRTLPTAPAAVGTAADAAALQQARAAALGLADGDCGAPRWGLSGRVALSNGRDGGSGRILWSQGAGVLHLELSAPISRQSWALDIDAAGARLQGASGALLRGADAAELVRNSTGWDVPIAALGCWLRAAAAAPGTFGPAQIEFGNDGLPRRILQGGWTIEYEGRQADPASGQVMPARVFASRGADHVRLAVERWTAE